MNLFIAVDDWQYDGGSLILGVYDTYEKAEEICAKYREDYKAPLYNDHRRNAITVTICKLNKEIEY